MTTVSFYQEGDCIAVPLLTTGFGIGIVTRIGQHGVVLGCFFGPKWEGVPRVGQLYGLTEKRSILVRRCADTGLRDGTWIVIGRSPDWNRRAWRVPKFESAASSLQPDQCWIRVYDDDLTVIHDQEVPKISGEGFPKDILSGQHALEVTLTQLLDYQAYLRLQKRST